jgi:metal-responsive CopG/Arc/MetJ family transcriptional regulator
MKTAVSIPDALFEEADELARREGVSRSHLYATALARYLEAKRRAGVRENLTRVYSRESSALDPVLERLQALSLPREEW